MMDEKDRFKAHLDLWTLQTNLLWGRYATLIQIQGATLATAYLLGFKDGCPVRSSWVYVAIGFCALGAVLTIILGICVNADITIRDGHAKEMYKIYAFNPVSPIDSEEIDAARKKGERQLHLLVFGIFVGIDALFLLGIGWMMHT